MAEYHDFLVQIDWETNLKVRKIRARFGAAGQLCLIRLWAYTAGNAPDGFLGPMTPEELGIACGADLEGIDPTEFGAALLAGKRPLVETTPSSLVVRDWLEHQPTIRTHLAKSRAGKEGARARWSDGTSMADSEVPSGCHDGRTMADPKCHSDSKSGHNASLLPSCLPAFLPPTHPTPTKPAPASGNEPPPRGGEANQQALSELEEDALDLIRAFLAIANRRGPPWEPPKVSTDGTPRATESRLVERALLDPAIRKDWRAVLADLDRLGLPDWWTSSKFGLGAFLKPGNFERFGTGEWAGSTPGEPDASLPPKPKYIEDLERERREHDLESERLRAERKRARETKATQDGGAT